jgi:putative transposase
MQPIDIRKSNVDLGKLYFWTATINNWYKLLQEDALKEIIISSLKHLSAKRKIEVYVFVIMPNPRLTGRAGSHLIWQLLERKSRTLLS